MRGFSPSNEMHANDKLYSDFSDYIHIFSFAYANVKYFKVVLNLFPICSILGACLHIHRHFPKHCLKGHLPRAQLIYYVSLLFYFSPNNRSYLAGTVLQLNLASFWKGGGERYCLPPSTEQCSFPTYVLKYLEREKK